jgi:hypothetical protein
MEQGVEAGNVRNGDPLCGAHYSRNQAAAGRWLSWRLQSAHGEVGGA